MRGFKDKLVLITGASSGIGESLALAFAAEGARLVLTARDAVRLEDVRQRCEALGVEARAHPAEVSDEDQVARLAEVVHARDAALDVLVNNAGVVMGGFCGDVEPAHWRRLHDINVMGVVHGIRAFVPRMIERAAGGHVVNMSSVSGFLGAPGMATYSASKFAVTGLSESLRLELHRHRIGVSTICPGFVRTPIQGKVEMVGALDNPRARARVDRDFQRTTLLPQHVAKRTLQAIRRNEALVPIGRQALVARTFKRWAPSLLERALRG